MSILPTAWELSSLLCKLLLYFGAASIAGGSLCIWQFSEGSRRSIKSNLAYILFGAVLGFQAVLLNFFIQLGLINDNGIAGMFDWGLAPFLMGTQVGELTFYRLAGFVIVLISSLLFLRTINQLNRPPGLLFYRLLTSTHLLALLLLATSFRIGGHISVLTWSAQAAISLHFLAFSLWIGSLYPLLKLTKDSDLLSLKYILKRFGDMAVGVLLILLAGGVTMLLQLLASPGELITTAYGLSIVAKLLLVLTLLLVAATNKFFLVPRLVEGGSVARLRNSIRLEMVLATFILVITSYLSTLIGPPGH